MDDNVPLPKNPSSGSEFATDDEDDPLLHHIPSRGAAIREDSQFVSCAHIPIDLRSEMRTSSTPHLPANEKSKRLLRSQTSKEIGNSLERIAEDQANFPLSAEASPSKSFRRRPVAESATSTAPTETSSSMNCVPLPPHFCVEKRNPKTGRALRITQREVPTVGTKETQTKVDVFDLTSPECPVIFSVKHFHSGVWGRQTIVHKNIFLACMLADVPPPLDIPQESRRLFDTADHVDHMHAYIERVTPYIRYSRIPKCASLYWWRAVGNGACILQNNSTGKILFFANRDKYLSTAVETLCEVINKATCLPPSFFEVNTQYPTCIPDDEMTRLGDPETEGDLGTEELKKRVENWATGDGIGPWNTELVIQIGGARRRLTNIRYSIGVDESMEDIILTIQVHKNEPLVRDLKAFPICVLQMRPRSSATKEVYLEYIRARFFVHQLFKLHSQYEGNASSGGSKCRESAVMTPRPARNTRTQSVRLPHRMSLISEGAFTNRPGVVTPGRNTPSNRRAISNLRSSDVADGENRHSRWKGSVPGRNISTADRLSSTAGRYGPSFELSKITSRGSSKTKLPDAEVKSPGQESHHVVTPRPGNCESRAVRTSTPQHSACGNEESLGSETGEVTRSPRDGISLKGTDKPAKVLDGSRNSVIKERNPSLYRSAGAVSRKTAEVTAGPTRQRFERNSSLIGR